LYGFHDRDAASALKNLGYSTTQARAAVAAARAHVGVAISLEGLIRAALRAAG
jgi:Holliday junction resolvasome RuvABC DNA-binding subunit